MWVFWSLDFDSHPGKFWTQLLLILNNIFHFRFCKTVSIGTTTPPKCIPAFDAKSSFEVQAVARRKHDQLNQNKTNLADLGLLTIILIAFCGFFMRFSEVSRLHRSDLIFSSTYVKVFIEKHL